jgi:tyrosine-protein phosphatase SIW14
MPALVRWTLVLAVVVIVAGLPVFTYRYAYVESHRLREVTPGRVYRSGEMTVPGFRDAVARYHFRTVINLQDEYPDPDVLVDYLGTASVKESELCRQLGVRYVYLPPDLISRHLIPQERPAAIDKFLTLMDDPETYPVLLHCRAGLHRTGVMVAVYRMEYEGWGPAEVIQEMKENGFGDWACTSANDYLKQYVTTFRRGLRRDPAP